MSERSRKLETAIKYMVTAKVIDNETGEVVEERRVKGQSFLLNFGKLCRLLFMRGDATESESAIDTGGTSRTLQSAHADQPFPRYGPAAGNKMRVRIGTNTTAFSRDQYDVLTFLAEAAYSTYVRTDTGSSLRLDLSFSWLNDTGTSKDVAETALVVRCADSGVVIRAIALTRDLFDPPITVGVDRTLSVGYTITLPW